MWRDVPRVGTPVASETEAGQAGEGGAVRRGMGRGCFMCPGGPTSAAFHVMSKAARSPCTVLAGTPFPGPGSGGHQAAG